MNLSFYPKRILFAFFVGFLWASFSSFYFYTYIRNFYENNLVNIANSLTRIITKKIHTKMSDYFLLINNIADNVAPSSPRHTRTEEQIIALMRAAMVKQPEFVSLTVSLNLDILPPATRIPYLTLKRNQNKEIILETFASRENQPDLTPFTLPPGQVYISTPHYNSESQVAVISLIRTILDPLGSTDEPLGYVEIELPLPYINYFLRASLGSTSGQMIVTARDQSVIIGSHFVEKQHLCNLDSLLSQTQSYQNREIGNQNYLIYRDQLGFELSPATGDIYLFLPTTRFFYSHTSLITFLISTLFLIFLLLFSFLFYFFWNFRQTQAQEAAFLDIEEESEKDPLTDTYNRTRARKYLDLLQAEYNEKGIGFCCLIFDLDFFKRVNDDYGHDKGDYVLKHLSYLIQLKIRAGDLLARIGGEEFLIVFKNIALENAYCRAEFLRDVVADYDFTFPDRRITISLGCAYVPSEQPKNYLIRDTKEILDTADKALYFSKNHGRNQTTLTIMDPKNLS